MIKVNETLRRWLEIRNWSNRELAEAIGYDEGAISKVINGKKEPSKQLMKKLMDLTGLDFGRESLFVYERKNGVS